MERGAQERLRRKVSGNGSALHFADLPPLHIQEVTFREDDSRARAGNAAENLAALRRLALNMLKNENGRGPDEFSL